MSCSPGRTGMPPGPPPRSPPRAFDTEVATRVPQPIRSIDHELRSSPASLRPRRLFPAIEPDEEEPAGEPDLFFCPDDEPTNDPAGQDFDEALEQIAWEGCCVCPLCGAIVARDGSVLG